MPKLRILTERLSMKLTIMEKISRAELMIVDEINI
jgi:hypothetical protein